MDSPDRVTAEQVLVDGFAANTDSYYDRWTIRLHWLVAAIVTLMWAQAQLTGLLPKGTLRLSIWSLHVILGFALAAVIVARVGWRLTRGTHLPTIEHGVVAIVAKVVHMTLYGLLIAVVILGVANVYGHGFPVFGIWTFARFWDKPVQKSIHHYHELIANVIAGLAFAHALAAVYHHLVLKDHVLDRMIHAS